MLSIRPQEPQQLSEFWNAEKSISELAVAQSESENEQKFVNFDTEPSKSTILESVFHAIGGVALIWLGFIVLWACIFVSGERSPEQIAIVVILGNVITLVTLIGIAWWVGRQEGISTAITIVMLFSITLSMYIYRQKRGRLSRRNQSKLAALPSAKIAGIVASHGLIILLVLSLIPVGGVGNASADVESKVNETQSLAPNDIAANLNEFWGRTFSGVGLVYASPLLKSFQGEVSSGCGHYDAENHPMFYCPIDNGVYYSEEFRDLVISEVGEYAFVYALAHEWGHSVQAQFRMYSNDSVNIDIELQADCLAGFFAAGSAGQLTRGDVRAAVLLAEALGDPEGSSWDDSDAHGTGDERAEAFTQGYSSETPDCNMGK